MPSLPRNLKRGPYADVHFNESGLHAWQPGRIPDGQYGPYMQDLPQGDEDRRAAGPAHLGFHTPVTVQGHAGQLDSLDTLISDRNAVCVPIMQEQGVTIDDLHALMMTHLRSRSWRPLALDARRLRSPRPRRRRVDSGRLALEVSVKRRCLRRCSPSGGLGLLKVHLIIVESGDAGQNFGFPSLHFGRPFGEALAEPIFIDHTPQGIGKG
ncbi:MAG: hypothetical protein WDO13_21860 [Verrucomicrobiota bacterium]